MMSKFNRFAYDFLNRFLRYVSGSFLSLQRSVAVIQVSSSSVSTFLSLSLASPCMTCSSSSTSSSSSDSESVGGKSGSAKRT